MGLGIRPKLHALQAVAADNARHDDLYGSRWNRLKALWLRATTPLERPPAPARMSYRVSLRLSPLRDKIYVRPSNSDFLVVCEIFEKGEYVPVADWDLPPDATVVDLGANIGLASVYFSMLVPGGRFVAVEPDADNCRLIKANCRRLVAEGRMQVIQAFAGARDGSAGIDRMARSWAFRKVDVSDANNPATEMIRCVSVPTLLDGCGFEHVDLLKCDVEGSEAELFRTCAPWIDRVRRLIVETHAPYSLKQLYADLRAAGWDFDAREERKENPDVSVCFLQRRE